MSWLHPFTPDSDGTVIMRSVRNGPVVVDGKSAASVPKVVVTATNALHTVWGR